MLTIEVKNNLGTVLFDGAFPKNDFETHEQKQNAEGVPLWQVSCLVHQPEARRSESITITVPAAKNPAESLDALTPVGFENLRVLTGEQNGRTWVAFHADRIGTISGK